MTPSSILIIQTAFIGDVILATGLIEKLNEKFPHAAIDFLLRKGNESLLQHHPKLRSVLIWNKKEGKIKNLLKLVSEVRSRRYDAVINVHRFGSSGLITAFSGAPLTIGFDKNPFSLFFTQKVKHEIGALHEVERNQKLIQSLADGEAAHPKLYPTSADFEKVNHYKDGEYICIAPASVWFTKQYPQEKWVELTQQVKLTTTIYLLGAPTDFSLCEQIILASKRPNVFNLSGKLSFLESAALMQSAKMNYVNDSAPMHLASSVNANVAAIYCSTVPDFGFGPLSVKSFVIQTPEKLSCRPCGLHGHRQCPQGHFKCATTIPTQELLQCLTV